MKILRATPEIENAFNKAYQKANNSDRSMDKLYNDYTDYCVIPDIGNHWEWFEDGIKLATKHPSLPTIPPKEITCYRLYFKQDNCFYYFVGAEKCIVKKLTKALETL
jgi:hypothetical protein